MTDYFSMKAQTQRYASLYERLLVLTPRRESGRNQFTPASLETGADTEPGSRLESVYPELLLKALEHFAGTMNYATADQRKICREMVRLLQDQPANSAQGAGAIGKQPMAELKSAFMTAETLRQERLRERRRRRVARRERWAGLFRKVGIRTKATPA
jgi:hypothetical protein